MKHRYLEQYCSRGISMLLLCAGLFCAAPAHSVAFYDATIEADLVITTNHQDLVINPAFGFTDFFSDVSQANLGSDAFGDADFFSTPSGFSAYAHADGVAVPSGAQGDTVVVESYGEAFAFMDVELFNAGASALSVDFFVDYLWDWSLGVGSELWEFAGLDLYLELEIDGIFLALVDILAIAQPGDSDFGGGLDLFSFEINPYGFSTLSMLLVAGGSAESTVLAAVPEPASLLLLVYGFVAFGLSRAGVLRRKGLSS